MEFVEHADGSKTHIPDAIIAASDNEPFDVAHPDPALAKAGVKITHHRRKGVEAYLKASSTEREHLHKDAIAKLAPKADESAAAAPPAAAEDDE